MHVFRNLMITLTVGLAGVAQAGPSVSPARPGMPTDNTIPDVAERVVDSVVNISIEADVQVEDPFGGFFGESDVQHMAGKGSGVIVTASGRILTNAHVVNNA